MNSRLLFIFILFFSTSFLAMAQRKGKTKIKVLDENLETSREVIADKKFRPFMANHDNEGCPTNSFCNVNLGQTRKQFLKILKGRYPKHAEKIRALNKFVARFGAPFGVWAIKKAKENQEMIHWDSHCAHHNLEDFVVYKGIQFVSKIPKKPVGGTILESAILLSANGKLLTWSIPRGEIPTYLKDHSLVFIQEDEGSYYHIGLDQKRNISIIEGLRVREFPESKKCPPKLVEHLKQNPYNKSVHQGYFCKTIWNEGRKKREIMAFPFTCQ